MEKDIKQLNLELLKKEYRNKGKALKGFVVLDNLIKSNKGEVQLSILLRSHFVNPIVDYDQVIVRNNIDYLLGFYSVIEVGIIAGYVRPSLDINLNNEINRVLGNEFVKKFYEEYYMLYPKIKTGN